MGLCNCWDKCCTPFGFRQYSSRMQHRKIVLLLLGLDNSGKSSTANGLAEDVTDTVPTVGFNCVRLKHRGYSVMIYDLGGGPQIRGIWPQYYIDVHGVIYVVDASDSSRIEENREILKELLIHEKIAGKPLLLLANKQDRLGALDELDIVEKLQIENLVNQQRCPTLVETCSATGNKRKLDPGILNGYRWLLRRIISDYEHLNERVKHDTEDQNKIIEETRKKWRMKQKEICQIDDVQEDIEYGNPFKPINMVVKQLEDADGHSHVVVQPSYAETTSGETLSLKSPDSYNNGVNGNVVQLNGINAIAAIKEQFEWKEKKQRKKQRKIRNNRTVPLEGLSSKVLPPLKQTSLSICSWARPASSRHEETTRELGKSMDILDKPTVIGNKHESSDSEDVMIASR